MANCMSCGSTRDELLDSPDGSVHLRRLFKCPHCGYVVCNLCLVTDPLLINQLDECSKLNCRVPLNTLAAFERATESHLDLKVKCSRCEKEMDVYKDIF